MKKIVYLSFAAGIALSANGIDDAFKAGKASGEIRAVYVGQNNEVSEDTYTTAMGGQLKFETAAWNDIKLGVAGYVSQKIGFATGDMQSGKTNLDVLNSEGKSFAYLGEAYADYNANDLNIRIGRQIIDTPMINADDIRMLPNTYEGIMTTYSGIDKTTFSAGHVQRYAGYDSGDDISKFKKPAEGSHGAYLLGITNESIKNMQLQGW